MATSILHDNCPQQNREYSCGLWTYGDKLSFQIFMFAHGSIWDTWLSQF